jgi:hypothetical protein
MRLFNCDSQPVVIDHAQPAVMPGCAHDFTREQIKAGITGVWSEENPRKGLAQERAFKRKRDKVDNRPGQRTEICHPLAPHSQSHSRLENQ